MIRQIVESVILSRMLSGDENTTVQMSRFFFDKFVEEVNEIIGAKVKMGQCAEMRYAPFGVQYTVTNRDYRDDTSDPDFEQELYNALEEAQRLY